MSRLAVSRAAWPAALAGLLGLGMFLRMYRLDGVITLYPDTYAQLRAVERLLSGTLPLSFHYPPGIALVMAPFFAVFPQAVGTMQAVIVLAGVMLIGVAYALARSWSHDERAALMAAAAVAIGGTFVLHSRVGWFDVINTLLVAAALALAPLVSRRGAAFGVLYGLLLFVTLTVRITNPIVLPALLLAALSAGPVEGRRGLAARVRPVLIPGVVLVALYVAYLATAGENITRFANPNSANVVALQGYLGRLGEYGRAMLLGYGGSWGVAEAAAAAALLALAVAGAVRLWETGRWVLLAVGYAVITWAPFHALYAIVDDRYAMPAHFFLVLLAAIGLSRLVRLVREQRRPYQRVGLVALLALGVGCFVGAQLGRDLALLQGWPTDVQRSRERAYEPIREALAAVDGRTGVLVSSQDLAVDRANGEMQVFSLLEHSARYGIDAGSIERFLAFVSEQVAADRTVYYHFTEYEAVQSRFRRYEMGFDAYFLALADGYVLRQVAAAENRPQRLYVLEPRSGQE